MHRKLLSWTVVVIFCATGAGPACADTTTWIGIEWQVGIKEEVARPDGAKYSGFKVLRVEDGSPAADAGIVEHDLIFSIDEARYPSLSDMLAAIRSKSPGETLTVGLKRAAELIYVRVPLASFEVAIRLFEQQAAAGDTRAMYLMGSFFHAGRGVTQDFKEARRWYLMAAEKGHAGAMNELGLLYFRGKGVKVDIAEANVWFRRAEAASGLDLPTKSGERLRTLIKLDAS